MMKIFNLLTSNCRPPHLWQAARLKSTCPECKYPCFSFRHFLRFRFISHKQVFFLCQIIQRFMWPFAVVLHQPALYNFPYFVQCSEQVKIQDFCTICPVGAFEKRILRGVLGLILRAVHHVLRFIVPASVRQVRVNCPSG